MARVFQLVLRLLLCSILLAFSLAHSQTDLQPVAVVSFALEFPHSQPERYSIRIPSVGLGHYTSGGRISSDSDATDEFNLDFPLMRETRERIFDLASKAGYFQKDLDSHKSVAFTGKKTLTYGDGVRSGASTYNYSTNSAVQALTAFMQNLSATLEFGHRLQYDRHYQKLALDDELKRMEDLARTNELVEVTAIQPVLDQIISDPSVINVTRARAQRLLDRSAPH